MKKKLLLRTAAVVLGLALVGGSFAAVNHYSKAVEVAATEVGQTGTINFNNTASGTAINAASVKGNDSIGNEWTVTTVGTTSFTANAAYYQVGSSSKPATSITFTVDLGDTFSITSFSAKFGGFNNTAGTISLKVGDETVGSGNLSGTSDVTVSNSKEVNGSQLTVTVTNIAKGVKAYYVSYTVAEPAVTPVATALNVNSSLNLDGHETSTSVNGELSYSVDYEAGKEGKSKLITSVTPSNGLNVSVDDTNKKILFEGLLNGDFVVTVKTADEDSSGNQISKNINVSIDNLAYSNTIEKIYSLEAGSEVFAIGYYVGDVANGPIIGDGKYGILLYKGSSEGWVAGETVVAVSGQMDIYKNLYELKNAAATVITDPKTIADINTPEILVIDSKVDLTDLKIANRKTSISGKVTSIKQGGTEKSSASSVSVGTNLDVYIDYLGTELDTSDDAYIFLKSGNYDASDVTKIFEGKTSGITIEGYSSFFTTFQIAFTNIVEAAEDYKALDFAQDFLTLIGEVCGTYGDDWNGKDNYSALKAKWDTLNSSEYYLKLDNTEKAALGSAVRARNVVNPEDITDINKAVDLYDYLCGKYTTLGNFITGREPIEINPLRFSVALNDNQGLIITITVASIAAASILGLTIFIANKKKRQK